MKGRKGLQRKVKQPHVSVTKVSLELENVNHRDGRSEGGQAWRV